MTIELIYMKAISLKELMGLPQIQEVILELKEDLGYDDEESDKLMEIYYKETMDKIRQSENGNLLLFREICVPEPESFREKMFDDDMKGVGLFWSWDKEFAEAYDAENCNEDILIGGLLTDTDSVNDRKTLITNLACQLEEKEITLKKDKKMQLHLFCTKDKEDSEYDSENCHCSDLYVHNTEEACGFNFNEDHHFLT